MKKTHKSARQHIRLGDSGLLAGSPVVSLPEYAARAAWCVSAGGKQSEPGQHMPWAGMRPGFGMMAVA